MLSAFQTTNPRLIRGYNAERQKMKTAISLLFGIVAMTVVGCVGPRTGSVGHRYVPPVTTTNLSGTVTSQQVGDQPPVSYAQTNFTVVSTSPVEERTWREKVLGQRPPGQPTVMPPFPNAGVMGVTPTTVTAPQGMGYQRSSGARYMRRSDGALVLAPSWQYGDGGGWSSRTIPSAGELGRFFLPGIYGGSGARITASVYARGRVDATTPSFLQKGRAHAVSIGTLPRYWHYGGRRVKSYQATVAVAGDGRFRSGLVVSRGR